MKFKALILSVFSLMSSGCLSLPTLQTGRTVGKNNVDVSLNGSYGKYSQNSVLDFEGEFDYKPVFGIRGNYGITQRIDLGFNLDQTSFVGPSFKYQFLGDQNSLLASSIGVEGGVLFGAFLFGNFTNYLTIPLYTSTHPTEHLAIHFTPRFVYTSEYIFASPTEGSLGLASKLSFFTNTYGFVVGKNNKVALEISSHRGHFFKPSQISIGYILSLRNL